MDNRRRSGGRPRGSRPPHDRSTSRVTPQAQEVWPASRSGGRLPGIALLALSAIVLVFAILRLLAASGFERVLYALLVVVLCGLVAGVAWLLYGLGTMRYRLTDRALLIEFLGVRRIIPYNEIRRAGFRDRALAEIGSPEPLWPGFFISRRQVRGRPCYSWATQVPRQRVLIETATVCYAISPVRPVRFMATLRALAPTLGDTARPVTDEFDHVERQVPTAPERRQPDVDPFDNTDEINRTTDELPPYLPFPGESSRPARRPVLTDRAQKQAPARMRPNRKSAMAGGDLSWFREEFVHDVWIARFLGAGIVLPALMSAYVFSQAAGLVSQLPIQWNALGDVVDYSSPRGLWRFPVYALIVLVANTALAARWFHRDRQISRLITAGIPALQLVLLLGLIFATN